MEPCTPAVQNNEHQAIPSNHHLADYQRKIIIDEVKNFEKSLDDDHETALKLASFGQSITLSVSSIGYENPDILIFHGFVGDETATLVQHITQLSFLLTAAKKRIPDEPPHRIGFEMPNDAENAGGNDAANDGANDAANDAAPVN